MTRQAHRRSTFVERVLDGHARLDDLEREVEAWVAGPQTTPLHATLGLDARELLLVAETPDALRYLVHARRFDITLTSPLTSQQRVRDYATLLAAETADPVDVAALETWQEPVARRPDCEATRA